MTGGQSRLNKQATGGIYTQTPAVISLRQCEIIPRWLIVICIPYNHFQGHGMPKLKKMVVYIYTWVWKRPHLFKKIYISQRILMYQQRSSFFSEDNLNSPFSLDVMIMCIGRGYAYDNNETDTVHKCLPTWETDASG